MNGTERGRFLIVAALSLTLLIFPALREDAAEAATVRMTPGGEELEFVGEDGISSRIPIYREGNIRYFSAGVGLEERVARYPAFPLKMIFVAGIRSLLSQISVTITDSKGAVRLQVPAEHVTGPWLFVDLPAGKYAITATRRDQTQAMSTAEVGRGRTRAVYLRWEQE
jgi:hypothetical protein